MTLSDGQRRAGVDIRLWRTAVVEGVVTDVRGEAVVGVVVHALRRVEAAGRASLISAAPVFGVTDDRGAYRMVGLEPGTYVIGTAARRTTFPVEAVDLNDPAFSREASRITNELQSLGSRRQLTVGKHVIGSSTTGTMPLAPQKGQPLRVYPQGLHLATSRIGDAQEVTLVAGDSRDNVNIQIRAVGTITISGRSQQEQQEAPDDGWWRTGVPAGVSLHVASPCCLHHAPRPSRGL